MENFRSEIYPDPAPMPIGGSNWRQMLIDIVETLVISLILFAAINFVSARIRVESVSMKETLLPGDFVLVNKLAYNLGEFHTGEIDRGDVVVFDPETIQDHATFTDPHQYATGMLHVFVNGEQVLKDGEHTGATPGRVVRGPGWTGEEG